MEAARAVAGVAAPHSELSHEEAENAFFHRTRALAAGRVHQAPPYVSPDTGEWVISNSTPLPAGSAAVPGRADGSPGVVHFEITVDSFREQAERRGSRFPVLLVDGRTGDVVTATSRAQRRDEPLGFPGTPLTRAVVAAGGPAGALTVDGTRAAYRRVAGGPDNANDWYVVTLSSELPGPWSTAGGRAAIGSAVGALLLLGSSLLALRSGQRQLRRAAQTDPLTGLPNRAFFTERLRQRMRLVPGGHAEAVLLLDLDGFKEVNDTLGHLARDRLLQQVADRIAGVLRPGDLVARLGGDEFAVHLPGIDDRVAAAAEVAATLLEAPRRPYVLDGVGIHVDGSVGITLAPQHGRTPEELLQHADVAMYQAKRDSAGFVVYDAASDPHSPERLQMVAGLLEAIESRRLDLHYQPQLDLAQGRVTGVEALVRWRHPRLGLLPPAEFVPMAERTGLIRPLTRCVLELALEQCAAWRAQGRELPVAVNCSALDVLDRRLPHEVGALLMHYDVPAHLLCLEITESSIMQEVERALEVLTGLHELGVRLAVDDFGTGYSSLA
ncbi:MAG: diguanylate cyclase [Actinomycetota bacterium]|nr:diguanylate cyclase [Actinomycetota bacterium]